MTGPFLDIAINETRKAAMMDKARAAVVDIVGREAPLTTADLFYLALGFVTSLGECYGDTLHPDNSAAALRAEVKFVTDLATFAGESGKRILAGMPS